jgi:DNA-binding transcriptional MerR regulator
MLSKDSYTINEVGDIVGVQPHVLLFWENQFPQLSPKKNTDGERVYSRLDVEVVQRIIELLYIGKHTINRARSKLTEELTQEDQ